MRNTHQATPNAEATSQSVPRSWSSAVNGSLGAAYVVAAPDDGIDLFDTAVTILRGWRIVVSVMALVGIVGFAAVYGMPGKYRASAALRADSPDLPDQSTPITTARILAEQKIEPAVLKQFAALLKSEENLGKAADDVGMDTSDESIASLSAVVSAEPSKDSTEILVSVTLPDPAAAEQLAAAWAKRGQQFLEDTRNCEIELTDRQLQTRRDEARKNLRDKRKQLAEKRIETGFEDKQASLASLAQQLNVAQREVVSNQSTIRLLEAKIDAANQRLQNTPATSKEIQRLGPISEVLARSSGSELQVEVERPNPTYEMFEGCIAQDSVALAAARRIVEEVSPSIPAIDQQIGALQHELDELAEELEVFQRASEHAQKDWRAADAALAGWQEAQTQLPLFVQDRSTPITVRAVGSSLFSRMVLLEAAAFALGCMIVLVRKSHRERKSATGSAVHREAGPAPIDRHGPETVADTEPQRHRIVA